MIRKSGLHSTLSLLVMTLIVMMVIGCLACTRPGKRAQGDAVIEKIEKFRVREHHLPKSLNEIGVPESEEGPIYYRQLNENQFQIWYGTELGESVTYDSVRKSWQ